MPYHALRLVLYVTGSGRLLRKKNGKGINGTLKPETGENFKLYIMNKPTLAQLDALLSTPCMADIELYGIDKVYLSGLARYYNAEINTVNNGEWQYIKIGNEMVSIELSTLVPKWK